MCIRDINTYDFHIYNWSPEELDIWYDLYSLRIPTVLTHKNYSFHDIEIDTSCNGETSKHIVSNLGEASLFAILESHAIPVATVVAQNLDHDKLNDWLLEWLRSMKSMKLPAFILVNSEEAKRGTCLAFYDSTIEEYNDTCIDYLQKNKSMKTWIKFNISDVLHDFEMSDCHNIEENKPFYCKCLIALSLSENLDDFRRLLTFIFIVAGSECAHASTKTAKEGLDKEIEERKIFPYKTDSSNSNLLSFKKTTDLVSDILKEAKKEWVKAVSYTDKLNPYYSYNLISEFEKLCVEFPMWTNICSSYSHELTISVEEFNEEFEKFAGLNKTESTDLYEFILMLIELKQDILRKGRESIKSNKMFKKKRNVVKEISNQHLNAKENWMGLIKADPDENTINKCAYKESEIFDDITYEASEKKIDRLVDEQTNDTADMNICQDDIVITHGLFTQKIYAESENSGDEMLQETCNVENDSSTADESFTPRRWVDDSSDSDDSCVFDSSLKAEYRNLIINGSKLPAITITLFNVLLCIKLINTCPMDSIFEIFAAAYCFSGSFRDLVMKIRTSKTKSEIFDILAEYRIDFSRTVYYNLRTHYCTKLYEKHIKRLPGWIEVDCQDNVTRLFQQFMNNNDCIYKEINCESCGYKNNKAWKMQLINTDLITDNDSLCYLQQYLDSIYSQTTKSCYNCTETATVSYTFDKYFCVELETNYLLHKDKNLEAQLDHVPRELYLYKEIYLLIGLVAFIPEYAGNLMHYYAFIRLPNGEWEERNNIGKEEIPIRRKKSKYRIKPALLFYVRKNVYW